MSSSVSTVEIDVNVLKEQVKTLSSLCTKMDTVIEKLIEHQSKTASEIYDDMEKRRQEAHSEIKELHIRITTVDRNLSDKIELTERRISEEIQALRKEILSHNMKEDSDLQKILEWKWMIIGAVGLFVWLVSNTAKVADFFK